MLSRRFFFPILALALSAMHPLPALSGVTEASYRQARDTIHRSLEAMGSADWPKTAVPLLFEAVGTRDLGAEHRGRSPGAATEVAYHEIWAWDPRSGSVGREYRTHLPGGAQEWVRDVFTASGDRSRFFLDEKVVELSSGPSVAASRDRNLRRFPPLLLIEALEQSASLRATGHFGPFESVQIQTREQETLSLFFGRESRYLGVVEYMVDLPTFSDTTVSWTFSDYRSDQGPIALPHRYSVRIDDRVLADMQVRRISVDAAEVEAFLRPGGDDWRQLRANAAPAGAQVETVADGVHRIVNLHPHLHFLYVEFDDFILAMDAPSRRPALMELPAGSLAGEAGDGALAAEALRLIGETVPGKPVRQLVLTHFHVDHAGGLLAFAGQPLELYATPADASAVEGFLARSHTLCRDERHDHPHFALRPVAQRRTIADGGGQVVDLIPAGPAPHAEQMLLAWLPKAQLLWVADTGVPGRSASDEAWLTQWLSDHPDIRPQRVLSAHGSALEAPSLVRVDAQQTLQSPRDP